VYFDGKRTTTRNADPEQAVRWLEDLLSMPFRQIHLRTDSAETQIRVSRKGSAHISRLPVQEAVEREPPVHNRRKRYLLPQDTADPFLQQMAVMDEAGRIRPTMQAKYRQVNAFLRLLMQAISPGLDAGRPIRIVDCGCGSALLTFAAYHYLHNLCGHSVHVAGVDSNAAIVGKCSDLAGKLGWADLTFSVSQIDRFSPDVPPDIVLSLHACDTATDGAIAQGIRWNSAHILAAPCCQHELHDQLSAPLFQPVLRHGILGQRTADILTDAFRALILRIMGYRTDVVEFISPEDTTKNLMIRARRGLQPGHRASVNEYLELKAFWQADPCLERMLGPEISGYLHGDRVGEP